MSEENKIYCVSCGSANSIEAKFCSNCGAKLETPAVKEEISEVTTDAAQEMTVEATLESRTEATPEEIAKVTAEEPLKAPDEIVIHYSDDSEEATGNQTIPPYTSQQGSSAGYSYSGTVENTKQDTAQGGGNSGVAIASMVCGILSLLCCCLSYVALVLSLAAVVLGIIALANKYDGKGMAIAGIVTGGIGAGIWLIAFLIGGSSIFMEMMESLS